MSKEKRKARKKKPGVRSGDEVSWRSKPNMFHPNFKNRTFLQLIFDFPAALHNKCWNDFKNPDIFVNAMYFGVSITSEPTNEIQHVNYKEMKAALKKDAEIKPVILFHGGQFDLEMEKISFYKEKILDATGGTLYSNLLKYASSDKHIYEKFMYIGIFMRIAHVDEKDIKKRLLHNKVVVMLSAQLAETSGMIWTEELKDTVEALGVENFKKMSKRRCSQYNCKYFQINSLAMDYIGRTAEEKQILKMYPIKGPLTYSNFSDLFLYSNYVEPSEFAEVVQYVFAVVNDKRPPIYKCQVRDIRKVKAKNVPNKPRGDRKRKISDARNGDSFISEAGKVKRKRIVVESDEDDDNPSAAENSVNSEKVNDVADTVSPVSECPQHYIPTSNLFNNKENLDLEVQLDTATGDLDFLEAQSTECSSIGGQEVQTSNSFDAVTDTSAVRSHNAILPSPSFKPGVTVRRSNRLKEKLQKGNSVAEFVKDYEECAAQIPDVTEKSEAADDLNRDEIVSQPKEYKLLEESKIHNYISACERKFFGDKHNALAHLAASEYSIKIALETIDSSDSLPMLYIHENFGIWSNEEIVSFINMISNDYQWDAYEKKQTKNPFWIGNILENFPNKSPKNCLNLYYTLKRAGFSFQTRSFKDPAKFLSQLSNNRCENCINQLWKHVNQEKYISNLCTLCHLYTELYGKQRPNAEALPFDLLILCSKENLK